MDVMPEPTSSRVRPGSAAGLAGWVLACLAAGAIGSFFPPGEWYAGLATPSWNPPNWIFAPVWTTLYILMGVAAWLVWRRGGFGGARSALGLFVAQLVLNGLWSILFFGLQLPGVALVDIVLLAALIVATIVAFFRLSAGAAVLLAPYLCWVLFAAALNFELWRLNR